MASHRLSPNVLFLIFARCPVALPVTARVNLTTLPLLTSMASKLLNISLREKPTGHGKKTG